MIEAVTERLAIVRDRVARAGGVDVRVIAVTKTWGINVVRAAQAAGCDGIGENYAQEMVDKLNSLADLPPVHFIGQLQANKVKLIAPFVSMYETIDRASVAVEVAKRAPGANVLIQTNADADPSQPESGRPDSAKGGCPLSMVAELIDQCRNLGLDPHGLMTVGPTAGGPEAARLGFRAVRTLLDRLGLAVCSMGMSDDLEIAVQEGSTEVRVGSALFGPRPSTLRRMR